VGFRLTFNNLERRYFTEICKPAFQHITASARIELIDQQVAQLLQRDRAAECVSLGQKWKTGTRRQYFTDNIGLPSTTVA